MSDFVEQCRQEWRRLGVPEQIAEEMATELASDIREAEADGIAVEEFLGTSASDARRFAASWATERGIIPASSRAVTRPRGRPTLLAFTGVAALALIIATVLLVTGEPQVRLVTSGASPHLQGAGTSVMPPPHQAEASAAAPIEWMLLALAIIALAFSAWLWSRSARSRGPMAPAN